jgi:hypothetical protein
MKIFYSPKCLEYLQYIGPYKLDHELNYKMEGPNAEKTLHRSI